MANSFTFELVSPEKLLLSGEVEMVTVPATEGDMGILANHAPIMTSLRPGLVTAKLTGGEESSYFVRGGFADITPTSMTVLAEFALPKDEITREIFEEQKRIAKEEYDRHHKAGEVEKAANSHSFIEQLNTLEPSLIPA